MVLKISLQKSGAEDQNDSNPLYDRELQAYDHTDSESEHRCLEDKTGNFDTEPSCPLATISISMDVVRRFASTLTFGPVVSHGLDVGSLIARAKPEPTIHIIAQEASDKPVTTCCFSLDSRLKKRAVAHFETPRQKMYNSSPAKSDFFQLRGFACSTASNSTSPKP